MTSAYADVADLKLYLGIADATNDAQLASALESASRWIDGECGRVFYTSGTALAPQSRYFTAHYADHLLIDDLVTLVTLKTDDNGDGTCETTWAVSDYRLYPRNAATLGQPYTEIRLHPSGSRSFPGVVDGVEIAGVWGYQATVPAQIKAACVREAARRFRVAAAPFGVQGSAEMGTMTVGAYDPEVRKDLAAFRLVVVG